MIKEASIKRAENGIRTRGLQFGKLMLYQLSYFRRSKTSELFKQMLFLAL